MLGSRDEDLLVDGPVLAVGGENERGGVTLAENAPVSYEVVMIDTASSVAVRGWRVLLRDEGMLSERS